jgi:hypothetical protein
MGIQCSGHMEMPEAYASQCRGHMGMPEAHASQCSGEWRMDIKGHPPGNSLPPDQDHTQPQDHTHNRKTTHTCKINTRVSNLGESNPSGAERSKATRHQHCSTAAACTAVTDVLEPRTIEDGVLRGTITVGQDRLDEVQVGSGLHQHNPTCKYDNHMHTQQPCGTQPHMHTHQPCGTSTHVNHSQSLA